MRKLIGLGTALAAFIGLSAAAGAAEVTLRAVSAFQPGTLFSLNFERFVKRVNEQGKGVVQIQFIGGPSAMPTFEIGNALRNGVVDMANTTAVFHANLVPEGVALTLAERPIAELRKNGGYDLMNGIHQKKARIFWLGRAAENMEYHIYLSKVPDSPDMKGKKLRSVPTYQSFFTALGATPMQIAPGEVYTALDRGVVDGYGWPSGGVFDLGWQEKTKARVEPGFYQVETGVFMSLTSWNNKLDDAQRTFLQEQMAWLEGENAAFAKIAADEKEKQAKAGIEAYTLPPQDAAKFLETAREAGWKAVIGASPEDGPKLRQLFTK
jgi:TRAP-type C4-dicarboxylate transport system substrate-binding protein